MLTFCDMYKSSIDFMGKRYKWHNLQSYSKVMNQIYKKIDSITGIEISQYIEEPTKLLPKITEKKCIDSLLISFIQTSEIPELIELIRNAKGIGHIYLSEFTDDDLDQFKELCEFIIATNIELSLFDFETADWTISFTKNNAEDLFPMIDKIYK